MNKFKKIYLNKISSQICVLSVKEMELIEGISDYLDYEMSKTTLDKTLISPCIQKVLELQKNIRNRNTKIDLIDSAILIPEDFITFAALISKNNGLTMYIKYLYAKQIKKGTPIFDDSIELIQKNRTF